MNENEAAQALGFRVRQSRSNQNMPDNQPMILDRTGAVIEWEDAERSGVRPATLAEVKMWSLLTSGPGGLNAHDVRDGLGNPKLENSTGAEHAPNEETTK